MRLSVFLFCALAFLQLAPQAFAVADRELTAKQAADAWLVYIDDDKYNEALALAAPELREGIKPKEWSEGLAEVRKPLGAVEKRNLSRLFPTSVLPGNIEGDFVVVNYRTKFAGREVAAEEILILSPKPDTDGEAAEHWQVMSFYIE